jgi:hypothetical protein
MSIIQNAQYGTGIEFFGERRKKITCFFSPLVRELSAKRRTTFGGLAQGGGFTAARTGAKLANSHKLSGELLPRLRQTARYV